MSLFDDDSSQSFGAQPANDPFATPLGAAPQAGATEQPGIFDRLAAWRQETFGPGSAFTDAWSGGGSGGSMGPGLPTAKSRGSDGDGGGGQGEPTRYNPNVPEQTPERMAEDAKYREDFNRRTRALNDERWRTWMKAGKDPRDFKPIT